LCSMSITLGKGGFVFGGRRDRVTELWRKLQNTALHNSHSLTNMLRITEPWRMTRGACSTHDKNEKCTKTFTYKRETKDVTRKVRFIQEYNIKMCLIRVGCEGVERLRVAWAFRHTVMTPVSYKANISQSAERTSVSRHGVLHHWTRATFTVQ
jgi:hypothetical protein